MTIKCKHCECKLPEEYFEAGDNCPKCDDLIFDAKVEMAEQMEEAF